MKFGSSLIVLAAVLAPVGAAAAPVVDCHKLAGTKVAAGSIGLPTRGARVTQVADVSASADGKVPAHCLVSGEIAPVDPAAPPIRFELALPSNWNGKALMLGGGGFDGLIPSVVGNVTNAPASAAIPLARGYAVFGSDSGHEGKRVGVSIGHEDAAFAGNDESYRNYIGDALKKTRDASDRLIRQAYGRAPARYYFSGGSKGGGEALMVAARWPADWDGVVALYPAQNFTVTMLGLLRLSQTLAAPGAYLDGDARGLLRRAALAACDGLDGVRDGLISNVRQCRMVFDPATATIDGKALRCAGGRARPGCLSDPQIDALRKAGKPVRFGFPIAGGVKDFPGVDLLMSGLGGSGTSPFEPMVAGMTIGTSAPVSPPAPGNAAAAGFADNFMRYAVARDPAYDYLGFDFAKPGRLGARLTALSRLDQVEQDLTPFAKRGGKLLILQGTEDVLVSPRVTERYVDGLRTRMGEARFSAFLRYYEVPGFGHALSTVFGASWDQLSALEGWVEHKVDPATNQIVADTLGVPGRTRPLCRYPGWPKYRGTGDVNSAASFSCSVR